MDYSALLSAAGSQWLVVVFSFALACLLSTWPGNWFIRMYFNHLLDQTKSPDPTKSMKNWLESFASDRELAEFRSQTSASIGCLERE